jgi:hypothetical protein
VAEFEAGLMPHQKAQVEGGGTVLERAVREHNVGACAKVRGEWSSGVAQGARGEEAHWEGRWAARPVLDSSANPRSMTTSASRRSATSLDSTLRLPSPLRAR